MSVIQDFYVTTDKLFRRDCDEGQAKLKKSKGSRYWCCGLGCPIL
jgi:hypothetical protein